MRLRVIDPEGAYWRRGVEAAGRWLRETGNSVLRVPYTVVTPEEWGGVGGYLLGQWIAEQRRAYAAGTLEAGRVAELEKLGMVWSEQDAAWADGIAVAREYAAVHGHFLPPATAVWEGHPIGVWAKNARAAARRARENEELRTAGLPVPSAAGAMTEARRDELDAIDPGWCPVWDTGWQRCFRLVQIHVQAGGTLPEAAGDVVVQGEDLGRWVNAQRFGWEQLLPVQRWILENTLKVTPAEEHERPVKQTQDTKWAANLAAARQFHAREGHLRVPRKHVERLETEDALSGRQGGTDGVVVRLGTWLDKVRTRAAKLPRTTPNRPRPARHALVGQQSEPHRIREVVRERPARNTAQARPSDRPKDRAILSTINCPARRCQRQARPRCPQPVRRSRCRARPRCPRLVRHPRCQANRCRPQPGRRPRHQARPRCPRKAQHSRYQARRRRPQPVRRCRARAWWLWLWWVWWRGRCRPRRWRGRGRLLMWR
ncbi:helicase associated domain-containing protein (plasmid) [Streptomyces sp. NBC_01005]|uniref:helicase associated domain-containing protein n=1 Tax=unclassified Streptomyces TaxID=2593676 RepID=UPI002F910CAA|nr:helicase associated domain-containing protein [Streptomyces sp. NBC_01005]WTD00715.1 helicase associated domain-containing protein [Streptomyces sp. NBC_01650]